MSPAVIELNAKGAPITVNITTNAQTTPPGIYYLFINGLARGEHQPALIVLELKVM